MVAEAHAPFPQHGSSEEAGIKCKQGYVWIVKAPVVDADCPCFCRTSTLACVELGVGHAVAASRRLQCCPIVVVVGIIHVGSYRLAMKPSGNVLPGCHHLGTPAPTAVRQSTQLPA